MMMNGGGWGGSSGGAAGIGEIFNLIFMLALIIGLILFVVWLVRQAGGANRILGGIAGPAAGGETALDILKTRYARGEIDLAEYEEKKRELTR